MANNKTKAIVVRNGGLSKNQIQMIQEPTPKKYIFTRQGRGGMVEYVKIGYTIQQLNKIFSPLGWDFEVVEEKETEKDVIVKGKLTIKDHKGHSVTKMQYGQADRQKTGVPLGDTYKAATSDALKKCASLLGLSLDVYAPILENTGQKTMPVGEKPNEQATGIDHISKLKAELYKMGAKDEKGALKLVKEKTGLMWKDFKITNKQAQIALFMLLNKPKK